MARQWNFKKGLHEIGDGMWAYVQPDGSWGWSNAGLIVDGDQTLLVDTLFDLKLTGQMLTAMRDAVPAAARIGTPVNTPATGDPTCGTSQTGSASCRERLCTTGHDPVVGG